MGKKTIENECGIQVTKRDVEILQFINECGFCIMPQIEERFAVKGRRSYQIMERLVKAGFLHHKRVFYTGHGIYYLANKGARFSSLPITEKISLSIYEHQIILTNLYLKLRKLYPNMEWISERRLIHTKYFDGVGRRGHVSDGILIFPDSKHVAIEVELHLKGKNRLERILKDYSNQLSIKEVWYFCPERIMKALTAIVSKKSFIKVFSLTEFGL